MNYIKYIPVLLLLLTGCTEEIDLNLDNEKFQRLVVEAWLTDEVKAHEVKLTLTADYFENEAPAPAENATVSITDGTDIFELNELTPGHYFTDENVSGKPGHTYTLNIDWDGKKYTATSFLGAAPPIDSLEYVEEEDSDTSDEYNEYIFLLYTKEPEGKGDNYYWETYPAETPDDPARTYWETAPDDFVDGNVIGGAEIFYMKAKPGESFIFEQYRITAEAFDFFTAIQFETQFNGGLFDSPPANIPSNVDNGAVGFFVTAGVAKSEITFQ